MAYRNKSRGMGATWGWAQTVADSDWANCRGASSYLNPGCYFGGPVSMIAPPQSPSGSVLTVPPASGDDAQATVDTLVNQQMTDQQTLAGSQVSSSAWDRIAGAAVETGDAISSPGGVSMWLWLALGVGVFGLVTLSGGSPRRYGR